MHLRHLISGSGCAVLALFVSFGGAAPALAQSDGSVGIRLGVGAGFETYTFEDPSVANVKSLSLLTTSFGASVPLFGAASVGVAGRYARGGLERANGSEVTLDGLTDTELSLNLPVRRGNMVTTVSGIAMLPTGNATLTEAEADLAGMIASELLPFRIAYWGSGGGIGLNVGAAHATAAGSFGMSAGYLVGRQFEPLQEAPFVYRPGNQLQLRAALDRTVGNAGKITLSLSMLHSAADLGDGENLYQAGDRYRAVGSYSFALGGRTSAILYLGGMHRQQGTALREITIALPAQDLLLAGGGLRAPVGGGVLVPSLDARVFRRTSGEGQGYATGLGLAWEATAGGLLLVPSVRGRLGRLVMEEGIETGLTGFDAGLAIRSVRRPGR